MLTEATWRQIDQRTRALICRGRVADGVAASRAAQLAGDWIAGASMADEPAIGHLRRLVYQNLLGSADDEPGLLGGDDYAVTFRKAHWLEALALMTGVPVSEYIAAHAMVGLLVPVSHFSFPGYGDKSFFYFRDKYVFALPREFACLCPDCVRKDLVSKHFTWFRRHHQMFGMEWCHLHDRELLVVEDPQPYEKPPHIWLSRGQVTPFNAFVESLRGAGDFVNRFVTTSKALLALPGPVFHELLNWRLSRRARLLAPRASISGRGTSILSHVKRAAPEPWLRRHFSSTSPRYRLADLDRLVDASHLPNFPSAELYTLALTALNADPVELSAALSPTLRQTEGLESDNSQLARCLKREFELRRVRC